MEFFCNKVQEGWMRSAALWAGRQCALQWPRWTSDLAVRGMLNRCVHKKTNALFGAHTHTQRHSEPSLATQNSSAHWFWFGASIIGYRGENDRLWLQGFGSEFGSEAREWDRRQHRLYLPLEICILQLLLRRSDDVLQFKVEQLADLIYIVPIHNKGYFMALYM